MRIRYSLSIVLFMISLGSLSGCGGRQETTFGGSTMGTTYHIKIIRGYFKSPSGLKAKIESRLQEINQSMSTYIPESEISRFNAIQNTREKLRISEDLQRVLQVGQLLYGMTGGAWDGTVKPLVNLWGFGNTQNVTPTVPSKEMVARRKAEIGFKYVDLSESGSIRKKRIPLSLDLASIAKGYAVDQIALLIRQEGIRDYLVEIGGEVYAAGLRKDRTPWRIGVNLPEKGAQLDAVYDIVSLEDRAMATSGDYRNFYEKDGAVYSHILDPRSGFPVDNGVVSVSIIADRCVFADGLATAVMVMGRDEGLSLVERIDGVEALIITRRRDNVLEAYASKGFQAGGIPVTPASNAEGKEK